MAQSVQINDYFNLQNLEGSEVCRKWKSPPRWAQEPTAISFKPSIRWR